MKMRMTLHAKRTACQGQCEVETENSSGEGRCNLERDPIRSFCMGADGWGPLRAEAATPAKTFKY